MSSVHFLDLLSSPLYTELQAGLFIPQLVTFSFFKHCRFVNPTVLGKLCSAAVSVHSFANTDTIFIQDVEAKDMCFMRGDDTSVVAYQSRFMKGGQDVKLVGGTWVAEGALWMPWKYRGTLIASTELEILFLNAVKFSTVTCVHPDLHFIARTFAFSFWEEFIDSGDDVTDLPRPSKAPSTRVSGSDFVLGF